MTDRSLPAPETIEQVKDEILAGSEFNQSSLDWEILKDAFGHIKDFFESLGNWSAAFPGAAQILIVVLTAILIALIVHILYVVFSEVSRVRQYRVDTGSRAQSTVVALEGQADSWNEAIAMAREALGAGDHYRTVWIIHRLFLGILNQKGAITFKRWKTNNDYLVECIREDPDSSFLRELTRTYDHIVYAHDSRWGADLAGYLDKVEKARIGE